ncbi:ATP-dependent nuclease [Corynebacterium pelargi]|uniref:Recombination protein F n=1 Tax=Corynebacterium pelargi TaxID=1471400 RepID=A0A410W6P0_9CORY|nr:ATP-dependent endonuclease [Corynebacterium pelargi]QAU51701.1 recombination protein F [Corynebacterium pelargi]GGG80604.1 ATP-dependent endonuclease [Corynebacterium pelargi]
MAQQSATPSPSVDQRRSPAPMRISKIQIQNFRLLRSTEIDLDSETTVLVGRNNSGKTTFAEACARFLQTPPLKLTLADFSSECYPEFLEAWEFYNSGDEKSARDTLPAISLTVEISYSKDLHAYGPLSAAIVDLDPNCTKAKIRLEYSLGGGKLAHFFEGIADRSDSGKADLESVLTIINDRVPAMYGRSITAIDPGDVTNRREITIEAMQRILTVHFLKAQRGLDDEKERPKDLIGDIFQTLFDAAAREEDGNSQKNTVEALKEAVADIERQLGAKVSEMVEGLIPALQSFGYPGLVDPGIRAETTLDIARVLGKHTSIRYDGAAGVTLPESYSGLGSRNLILMLFTLLSYYREFASRGNLPGLHLIFIEEPEAHLHPQMQEVFIEQLASVSMLFPALHEVEQNWWPQFTVSTHSSHVANRAKFSAIRYFRVENAPEANIGCHTVVLNLTDAEDIDEEFLHKYLTLVRSDLFFADKAILVEGTSERLIVPAGIRNSKHELGNQYVTIMEVGGAYAHLFFPLLDFLHIPTLVITDIDAVEQSESTSRLVATTVHSGTATSNETIKKWFENPEKTAVQTPTDLLEAAKSDEIISKNRYLAFQVPEADTEACGRTFEDAFLLANPEVEGLTLTKEIGDEQLVREAAGRLKKSDFALRFAVDQSNWKIPRYIQQGLDWLVSYPTLTEPEQAATGVVL